MQMCKVAIVMKSDSESRENNGLSSMLTPVLTPNLSPNYAN